VYVDGYASMYRRMGATHNRERLTTKAQRNAADVNLTERCSRRPHFRCSDGMDSSRAGRQTAADP
jgi:hypothetical protein